MYREFIEALSDDQIAEVDAALSIDPVQMVATILAIREGVAIGHAALRPYGDELEVKKVFVSADVRGQGISRELMLELERIAAARGVASLVLQTGPLQVPAIRLYESLGYEPIPPYGKYGVIENALCYRKVLERLVGSDPRT